jgi:hypothetical protein
VVDLPEIDASVFASNSPDVLWRAPSTGGDGVKVGVGVAGRLKNLAIRPHGQTLLFTLADSQNNELWTLEHVLPGTSTLEPRRR